MGSMAPGALKIVALNFALKMLSVENTYVATGRSGVLVTQEPANLFRPRSGYRDAKLAIGLQYPIDLFYKTDVIGNMFQDLGTDKAIYRVISQR